LEGSVPEWGETTKIIYRHYATLYFIFAVDKQESDLGILDLIQVFVESLDKCFENVCELDLIFHSDRVNYILDEIIMAGMVLETNINHILSAVSEQNKLHASSLKSSGSSSAFQSNSASAQAKDIGGKLFSTISNSFKSVT
jgi:AP-3 complex subunit sigma